MKREEVNYECTQCTRWNRTCEGKKSSCGCMAFSSTDAYAKQSLEKIRAMIKQSKNKGDTRYE